MEKIAAFLLDFAWPLRAAVGAIAGALLFVFGPLALSKPASDGGKTETIGQVGDQKNSGPTFNGPVNGPVTITPNPPPTTPIGSDIKAGPMENSHIDNNRNVRIEVPAMKNSSISGNEMRTGPLEPERSKALQSLSDAALIERVHFLTGRMRILQVNYDRASRNLITDPRDDAAWKTLATRGDALHNELEKQCASEIYGPAGRYRGELRARLGITQTEAHPSAIFLKSIAGRALPDAADLLDGLADDLAIQGQSHH